MKKSSVNWLALLKVIGPAVLSCIPAVSALTPALIAGIAAAEKLSKKPGKKEPTSQEKLEHAQIVAISKALNGSGQEMIAAERVPYPVLAEAISRVVDTVNTAAGQTKPTRPGHAR